MTTARPVRRAATAALAAAAILAPAGPAQAARTCHAPPGATAIHRDRSAVVYRRARNPRVASIWACLRATGKLTALPGTTTQRRLSSLQGAGRFLAFFEEDQDFHGETATVGVHLFDLRARRSVGAVVNDVFDPQSPDRRRLHDLILTTSGATAWRVTGPLDRIHSRDARGALRILDSGPSGTLTDLVLVDGATAQWRDRGRSRSHRL